ncbi:hypothetical protein [Nocardia sp. CDC160]|uniref:hypothetical protein n=1 Tax=Nocardia sp. CDC160 TaxID=3112166 RepID=UPI002DB66D2D|nr:hypothetical protein [Nocardia sp. CDC160]MEC3917596.1 hypothetical protein [Nocardia sp. CDC160]
MDGQLRRRSVLGLGSAAVLGTVLTACGGGKKKHDKPATSATPASPPPATGSLPDTIMIIRHAEKPTGSGKPYGITADGEQDEESLTVRGWTRAGALVELFDPWNSDGSPASLRPGLLRPAAIYASDPGSHGSKRPEQTVTPLAAALNVKIDARFPKGQEAQLVAALSGVAGPVLISWQHENIGAILAQLSGIAPAPPKSWPDDRFDIVYVLTRNGTGWTFTQVPQMLIAGDSPAPIA